LPASGDSPTQCAVPSGDPGEDPPGCVRSAVARQMLVGVGRQGDATAAESAALKPVRPHLMGRVVDPGKMLEVGVAVLGGLVTKGYE
jgi:hypothetical protein